MQCKKHLHGFSRLDVAEFFVFENWHHIIDGW